MFAVNTAPSGRRWPARIRFGLMVLVNALSLAMWVTSAAA